MRHVKLRPDGDIDAAALMTLIETAYLDIKRRVEAEWAVAMPPACVSIP